MDSNLGKAIVGAMVLAAIGIGIVKLVGDHVPVDPNFMTTDAGVVFERCLASRGWVALGTDCPP